MRSLFLVPGCYVIHGGHITALYSVGTAWLQGVGLSRCRVQAAWRREWGRYHQTFVLGAGPAGRGTS